MPSTDESAARTSQQREISVTATGEGSLSPRAAVSLSPGTGSVGQRSLWSNSGNMDRCRRSGSASGIQRRTAVSATADGQQTSVVCFV